MWKSNNAFLTRWKNQHLQESYSVKLGQRKIAITEMHISTHFCSLLFIIFTYSEVNYYLSSCYTVESTTILLLVQNFKKWGKKHNLCVSSIHIGKIISWNQLHTGVFEKQHDNIVKLLITVSLHYAAGYSGLQPGHPVLKITSV